MSFFKKNVSPDKTHTKVVWLNMPRLGHETVDQLISIMIQDNMINTDKKNNDLLLVHIVIQQFSSKADNNVDYYLCFDSNLAVQTVVSGPKRCISRARCSTKVVVGWYGRF